MELERSLDTICKPLQCLETILRNFPFTLAFLFFLTFSLFFFFVFLASSEEIKVLWAQCLPNQTLIAYQHASQRRREFLAYTLERHAQFSLLGTHTLELTEKSPLSISYDTTNNILSEISTKQNGINKQTNSIFHSLSLFFFFTNDLEQDGTLYFRNCSFSNGFRLTKMNEFKLSAPLANVEDSIKVCSYGNSTVLVMKKDKESQFLFPIETSFLNFSSLFFSCSNCDCLGCSLFRCTRQPQSPTSHGHR
jgi:hypothetical protein